MASPDEKEYEDKLVEQAIDLVFDFVEGEHGTTFVDFVKCVASNLGEETTRKMGPLLRDVWNTARESYAQLDEAADIDAVLCEKNKELKGLRPPTPRELSDICGSRGDLLLDISNLELYRANAFRILGLPVTVNGAEISRQQKMLKMREKLGGTASPSEHGVLPLNPLPDVDAVRSAGQRLHDMQTRLVDELFWFWPTITNATTWDKGHASLRAGDIMKAHQFWSSYASEHKDWPSAVHNLAVLHHSLALDLEHASNGQSNPDDKLAARRDQHWRAALRSWFASIEHDPTWDYLTSRAKELDDPRLTTTYLIQLRHALPSAILGISVRLAVRAAKRGETGVAKRHLNYIGKSGFDCKLAARLAEKELLPLVDEVRRICDPVAEQSKAAPAKANQLAKRVLEECGPLLAAIAAILNEKHHVRQTAFNHVAGAIRGCMIDYGNETEDWDGCVPLLNQAAKIALDEGLRSRLRDDLSHVTTARSESKRVEELKKAVTADRVYDVSVAGGRAQIANVCTCCLEPAQAEQTVTRTWEETRGLTRYKRTLSFNFPVCRACLRHQSEYSSKRAAIVVSSAGLSTAIAFVVASNIGRPSWLLFIIIGAILTSGLAYLMSAVIRLRELPAQHACRDCAVEMPEASDRHVVFRFHNPIYAEAFADSNGVKLRERQMGKPTRGTFLLAGSDAVLAVIVAIFIGGIGQSLIYAARDDDWNRRRPSPTNSTSTVSPPTYSQPPIDSPSSNSNNAPLASPLQYSQPTDSPSSKSTSRPAVSPPQYTQPRARTSANSGLSNKIDLAKARVRILEAELSRMDSAAESISKQLDRYKSDIEGYERQVRAGIRVDESQYQKAIDEHNRLVKQHNASLADRKRKYDEYSKEVDSVNEMVTRYNRGDR